MRKAIAFLTVLVLVMAVLVRSCAAPVTTTKATTAATTAATTTAATTAGEKLKFAFIGTSNVDESIIWMRKNFEEACAKLGVEAVSFDANGDVQKQINLIGDAIAAGCDAVVFPPMDKKALIAGAKKAKDAGLFVCCIGGDLDVSGQQYRDFFCGPNDIEAGQTAAKAIIAKFPEGAAGVMVMGGAGDDAAVKRESGFVDTIKGTNIVLLDKQNSPWDVAKCMSITEDFITKYGDQIKWIYCHWDNGAVGVVQALEAKGMKDVYILSVDGCRAGFKLVNDGKIAGSIYQDMALQATNCVDAAFKLSNGETLEAQVVHVPWTNITKDTANFDPGW